MKRGNNGTNDISLRIDTDISDTTSARIALSRGSEDGMSFDEATGRDDGVHSIVSRFFSVWRNNGVVWNTSFLIQRLINTLLFQSKRFLCNSQNPAMDTLIVAKSFPNGAFCSVQNSAADMTSAWNGYH